MLVCEAAGYDVIIVETVGVGQSETTVASMVDFFLVLMIAGAGDELQGIKKGVLEVADAIVINKADGDNILRAQTAQKEYQTALHLLMRSDPVWTPPVLTCSSVEMTGLAGIWQTIADHRAAHKTARLDGLSPRRGIAAVVLRQCGDTLPVTRYSYRCRRRETVADSRCRPVARLSAGNQRHRGEGLNHPAPGPDYFCWYHPEYLT